MQKKSGQIDYNQITLRKAFHFACFDNVKTVFPQALIRIFEKVRKYCLLLVLSLSFLFGINRKINAAGVSLDATIPLPAETVSFSPAKTNLLHEAIRISAFQNNMPQVQHGIKKFIEFHSLRLPVRFIVISSFHSGNASDGLYAKSYLNHIHPYYHFW